jgi:hypothetical protein
MNYSEKASFINLKGFRKKVRVGGIIVDDRGIYGNTERIQGDIRCLGGIYNRSF